MFACLNFLTVPFAMLNSPRPNFLSYGEVWTYARIRKRSFLAHHNSGERPCFGRQPQGDQVASMLLLAAIAQAASSIAPSLFTVEFNTNVPAAARQVASAPAPPPPSCAGRKDVEYGHLTVVRTNTTSAAMCCAACEVSAFSSHPLSLLY